MTRFVLSLLLVTPLLAADPYQDTVAPFLRAQCQTCHSGAKPAGGLAIDTLLKDPNTLRKREHWERIAQRIAAGEMPPKGTPRPDPTQARTVTSWIESAYDALDRNTPIDPGRVTARRLNRFEYANSVRDLLGIDLDPAADLPPDPYGYGFDNIGDVLSINAALTEQYLKTAERISRTVIPIAADPEKPVMLRYLAERIGQDRQLRLVIDHAFPADGEYTLRAAFYQALKDGTHARMRIFVDGRPVADDVLKFYYQIDRAVEGRAIPIPAGKHRVEATIEVLPDPPYKGSPPYLEYLQIYGPLKVTPTKSKLLTCDGTQPDCARSILAPLARRAWRRPVTAAELDTLLSLTHKEHKRTGSFEQAMRTSLQAILISPHFLYRIERDRGTGPQPLTDLELATRLSYFLWSSLPDDALLNLAEKGQLRANLGNQARRMLADPRSAAFVESFAGQWLQTRNLTVLKPDPTLFPTFTGELAADMRTETHLFFATLLKQNRPITDFLDAPFTFLNERLAKHYGIPNITGPEFRRVDLDGTQRSGVLTHASVLTVSSYPTRTSPVIRGKWVLENLLNQPPPPPPPNVPGLADKPEPSAGSLRQQLEKHRTNAACAACHARMDPLGFGLENYDAIGRWRTRDNGVPIDPSGTLPDGKTFATPAHLKTILKGDADTFTRALAEKMLTYATGRGMELADRAAIRRLAAHVRDNDYRFQALILGTLESQPFLSRNARVQSDKEGKP
ncbi:MAG: DUF1592 domain-containing protein [Bryobacterales bacterium]|nr:DUF1592 domain-containing protein [Bryobacterales bacterium]